MLNYELRFDEGILVLKPDGQLAAEDFRMLACNIDAYLDQRGPLRGVMVKADEFPGWKNFGALLAHLNFVRLHHRKIEKVAVVSDATFASVIPQLAKHFVRAKVKHFNPSHAEAAWNWLVVPGRAWLLTAA